MGNPSNKEKLLLVPRIRVKFKLIQVGPRVPVPEHRLRHLLRTSINDFRLFGVNVKIPESDIILFNDFGEREGEGRVVRQGILWVRNLSFVPDWIKETNLPRLKLKEFIRDKLSALRMSIDLGGGNYEFREVSSHSLSEDADQMMNLVAKPTLSPLQHQNQNQNPHTIVIKGVPSQWFVDQPDDSKPNHQRLLEFFQHKTCGKIRVLDTSENDENATYCNVSIQYKNYQECYKALKRLCSYSLLKVEKGGSKMTADYEVIWKDSLVYVSQEVHPDKRSCEISRGLASKQEVHPDKRSCEISRGLASKQVSLAPDSQDMLKYQALEHEMALLREHCKNLEAKLEACRPH